MRAWLFLLLPLLVAGACTGIEHDHDEDDDDSGSDSGFGFAD